MKKKIKECHLDLAVWLLGNTESHFHSPMRRRLIMWIWEWMGEWSRGQPGGTDIIRRWYEIERIPLQGCSPGCQMRFFKFFYKVLFKNIRNVGEVADIKILEFGKEKGKLLRSLGPPKCRLSRGWREVNKHVLWPSLSSLPHPGVTPENGQLQSQICIRMRVCVSIWRFGHVTFLESLNTC